MPRTAPPLRRGGVWAGQAGNRAKGSEEAEANSEREEEFIVNKQLNPVFTTVVIAIALALGALYFMYRYREDQARFEADKAVLQSMAERGRMGREGRISARLRAAGERGAGRAVPGSAAKPRAQAKKSEAKAGKHKSGR